MIPAEDFVTLRAMCKPRASGDDPALDGVNVELTV